MTVSLRAWARTALCLTAVLAGSLWAQGGASGAPVVEDLARPSGSPAGTSVIVGFRSGASPSAQDSALASVGLPAGAQLSPLTNDARVVPLPAGVSVARAVALLTALPGVRYAEANGTLDLAAPNDAKYLDGSMWNLDGSSIEPGGEVFGTNAAAAWGSGYKGSTSVAVGVIDTGVMVDHPDLQPNRWINPGEIPGNRKDDDANGYKDDVYGWDFLNNNASVFDGSVDDHGTRVAGVIGASAYLGGDPAFPSGTVGVNWDVRIIPAKLMSGGTIAQAVAAFDYLTRLKTRGVANVVAINASWGKTNNFFQSLLDAINRAGDAGILVVAAAGNSPATAGAPGNDDDVIPFHPASYRCVTTTRTQDCLISVTAIDRSGELARDVASGTAYTVNFGQTTVDLAAPGKDIWSTVPVCASTCVAGWGVETAATSWATPHVAGAAALCASINDKITMGQIRNAILASARSTGSLVGKTVTGGRLDIAAMVPYCENPATSTRVRVSAVNPDPQSEIGGSVLVPAGMFSQCPEGSGWTLCREFEPGAPEFTLTAQPASKDFRFVGWSGGGCSGTGICVVGPYVDRDVIATFERVPTWTLTYDEDGFPTDPATSSRGTVTIAPAASLVSGTTSCSGDCSRDIYDAATALTLTAQGATGYRFKAWTGCPEVGATPDVCQIASPIRSVPSASALTVKATFEPIPTWTLHYDEAGYDPTDPERVSRGSVTIAASSAGLLAGGAVPCAGDCDLSIYDSTTSLGLAATAAPGFVFTGWTGACTGLTCAIASPLQIEPPLTEAAATVTATFAVGYTLSYTQTGVGSVSFSSSPSWAAASCSTGCSPTFPAGTVVTVTATPGSGYLFSSWGGDCGTGTCVVTMDGPRSVSANFSQASVQTLTVKLQLARNITASVVSNPIGISCSSSICSAPFGTGTSVQLSISASNGTKFAWSGCTVAGSGRTSTCTVSMTAAKSVTLKVS